MSTSSEINQSERFNGARINADASSYHQYHYEMCFHGQNVLLLIVLNNCAFVKEIRKCHVAQRNDPSQGFFSSR